MKKPLFSILVALAVVLVFPPVEVIAQVRETPVVIALVEGGNPQGYIQNTNDQGVLFATTPGGAGNPIPYSKIRGEGLEKLIRFEERAEVLGEPRALFAAEDYEAAADSFGQVARNYAIILSAPQNFATEAFFYQAESLKRAGKYAELAVIVNAPVAKTIETKLSERYQRAFEFQKLWALLGENKMAELKAALETYQEPVVGDAKLLSTPNFKKGLPATEIAELAYLRAKTLEADGQKENALDDYYRTFTLAFGNDTLISKMAMKEAMAIQAEDPRLERKDDRATSQIQSLAYQFTKQYPNETLPPELQQYAVRPAMVVLVSEAEKPAEEAEAGEKPADDAKPAEGEKPADDAKPAEGEKPADDAKPAEGEKKGE